MENLGLNSFEAWAATPRSTKPRNAVGIDMRASSVIAVASILIPLLPGATALEDDFDAELLDI